MTTPAVIDLPDELKESLVKCPTLPSLPAVVMQVIEASKDPDIGLAEVAGIVCADPALSAKLLKIANSPLYSLRRVIHNLREALTLLGLNASITIALSFTLIKSLQDGQTKSDKNDHYWRRSLLSAAIARHMGSRLGLTNLEDLFLASLLQDIGVLVIECMDTDFYHTDNADITVHNDRILHERTILNIDHAAIGAWLLQSWNLPEKLYMAVLESHQPKIYNAESSSNDLFQQCINLASNIADIWLDGNQSELLRENIPHIETILKIDDTEFGDFISDINNLLPELSSLFDMTLSDDITREQVLDNARELLLERNLQIIKQSEQDRRQLERMEEKTKDLEEVARRDPLTSIFNRKHFELLLEDEFENSNLNRWPLSVAFIDLDNFKQINDTHGHLVGDEVLKRIADFFEQNIRQTDYLARYGGDEFILMLPGSTNDVALNMLNRLLSELRKSLVIQMDDLVIKQTVSIGVATHMDTHNFNNIAELLNAADEALYKVKDTGRDNVASY